MVGGEGSKLEMSLLAFQRKGWAPPGGFRRVDSVAFWEEKVSHPEIMSSERNVLSRG